MSASGRAIATWKCRWMTRPIEGLRNRVQLVFGPRIPHSPPAVRGGAGGCNRGLRPARPAVCRQHGATAIRILSPRPLLPSRWRLFLLPLAPHRRDVGYYLCRCISLPPALVRVLSINLSQGLSLLSIEFYVLLFVGKVEQYSQICCLNRSRL